MEKISTLYQLYETTMADIPRVCQKGCADCCTCNVVVTSLEAALLVHSLDSEALAGVRRRLAASVSIHRYTPRMTFNQFGLSGIFRQPVGYAAPISGQGGHPHGTLAGKTSRYG